jgi:hypothetical protein
MSDRSLDSDTRPTASVWRHQMDASPRRHFRRPFSQQGIAERVAQSMISRHGANAAREATQHLNRVIDRGDLAARDLWACVVHIIHDRQNGGAASTMIGADDRAVGSAQLAILAK